MLGTGFAPPISRHPLEYEYFYRGGSGGKGSLLTSITVYSFEKHVFPVTSITEGVVLAYAH